MNRTLSVCFFLLLSSVLFGQDSSFLLAGKINKRSVLMDLSIYEGTCSIRYYYTDEKKDRLLEGTVGDNYKIEVATPEFYYDAPKEKIHLKKTTSGFAGTYIAGKDTFAVLLTETSLNKYTTPFKHLIAVNELKEDDPYDYIKTAGLFFTKESTSTNGAAELEWYKEKYSGISMPRLKAGYAPQVMNRINDLLLEKHLMESINYLGCSSGNSGEYDLSTDYIFADKNILSINITISFDCGGVHPDFGSEGLNFNAQTGELLELDKIFWFGKTKPPSEDSDQWYDYRTKVFSPQILKLLGQIYPDQMKPVNDSSDQDCDYNDPDVWDYPNWYFTSKGLYLGAVFGRVARVCDSPEWSIIPYKFLQPYLSPDIKIKLPE